jgi:hypothetical protein
MVAALPALCGLDDSGAPGLEYAFATSRSSDREPPEDPATKRRGREPGATNSVWGSK